jgi:hypothetical protein
MNANTFKVPLQSRHPRLPSRTCFYLGSNRYRQRDRQAILLVIIKVPYCPQILLLLIGVFVLHHRIIVLQVNDYRNPNQPNREKPHGDLIPRSIDWRLGCWPDEIRRPGIESVCDGV